MHMSDDRAPFWYRVFAQSWLQLVLDRKNGGTEVDMVHAFVVYFSCYDTSFFWCFEKENQKRQLVSLLPGRINWWCPSFWQLVNESNLSGSWTQYTCCRTGPRAFSSAPSNRLSVQKVWKHNLLAECGVYDLQRSMHSICYPVLLASCASYKVYGVLHFLLRRGAWCFWLDAMLIIRTKSFPNFLSSFPCWAFVSWANAIMVTLLLLVVTNACTGMSRSLCAFRI